jgi:hypothetical protein
MRMTDLMSGAALTLFPLIGIVIFGLIFLATTIRVLRSSGAESRRHSELPLEEATLIAGPTESGSTVHRTPNAPERTDA